MAQQYSKAIRECVIYWDYENCPIPMGTNLGRVIAVIKNKVVDKLGGCLLPFRDIQLYVSKNGKHIIPPKVLSSLDTLGVDYIPIECQKPETVDKRILADIGLNIFDWKNDKYNAIVVISGDKDFGYILSKIKHRDIAKTIVIPRLFKDEIKKINPNYPNAPEIWIDYDDFDRNEFNDICPTVIRHKYVSSTHRDNCIYYHPQNEKHNKRNIEYEQKGRNNNDNQTENNTQQWAQGKVCIHVLKRCNTNKKRNQNCGLRHVNANTVYLPCHWEKKCGFCHNHNECIFAIHKNNKNNNPYLNPGLLQNQRNAHRPQSNRVERGGSYDNNQQHKPQYQPKPQSRSYDNDDNKNSEIEQNPAQDIQAKQRSIKDLVCIFAPNCKNAKCRYGHPKKYSEKGMYYCQRALGCNKSNCLNFNKHEYEWINNPNMAKPKEYLCQFDMMGGGCSNDGVRCTMRHREQ